MYESLAEKAARLASVTGNHGGSRPAVAGPSPARTPRRLAVPAPASVDQEREEVAPSDAAMQQLREFVAENTAALKEELNEDQASPSAAKSDKGAQAISSFDTEVLELVDTLDPVQLIMEGRITRELEIIPGYSVSVRSLTKADLTSVYKDVDAFRRGGPADPEDSSSEHITPFPSAVQDFAALRQLAEGILGLNGEPLGPQWESRMLKLESLGASLYDAILREYRKFLAAVGLLFPDKPTQKEMDKIRDRLGKARAHH